MKKYARYCINAFNACLALCVAAIPFQTQAQQRPLWELGIGTAAMHLPYYRGSESGRGYVLPYPYIIYRGEYLNVDEGEVRGLLYQSDDFVLDLSMAGGVPVPSDENGPRIGMPDLDPTLEFGPSAEFRLWHNKDRRGQHLWLHLPLRAAYSLDGRDTAHEGWIFAPYLEFSHASRDGSLEHSISFGPMFADDAYHDYFYGVNPAFATPSRPAYEGRSGYNGSRLTLLTQKRVDSFFLSAFLRLDQLNGAVFTDSPLLQTRNYHIIGIAVSWILARSDETVYSR